ncbi:RNase A-like domain-containing protein [Brevibacillus sp. 179-C9.3 HS]|uniref:RNase A-like domain-containing protein n=1 Tax=unclassified Brevibacillus TaxID=2684853 RepID=UPI0039A38BF4
MEIDNIKIVKNNVKVAVYNFTVADFHTYFVSSLGIWVRNITCIDPNTLRILGDAILDKMEKIGGHTIERHVSMTNSELIKRANQGDKPGDSGKDATSYPDLKTATKATQNIYGQMQMK